MLFFGVVLQVIVVNIINFDLGISLEGVGGQVIFNGLIIDSFCNVDSSFNGQKVDLGKWVSNYFIGIGFEIIKIFFYIKVKDCLVSVIMVVVLFDGVCDQFDNFLLVINGGVSGVVIKLYEYDWLMVVSFGKMLVKQMVILGISGGIGFVDFEFYVDYIFIVVIVMVGKVDGIVNFNMIYN